MSFIHTEEWTWIVIDPTLLIYCMLVCVFYDSHFHTWIRLYFYVIYLFQCNEWLFCDGIICSCDSNFDIKFRFKNQTIKIEYVFIFLLYIKDEVNFVTNLNCLWCSFSQEIKSNRRMWKTANKMWMVFCSYERRLNEWAILITCCVSSVNFPHF